MMQSRLRHAIASCKSLTECSTRPATSRRQSRSSNRTHPLAGSQARVGLDGVAWLTGRRCTCLDRVAVGSVGQLRNSRAASLGRTEFGSTRMANPFSGYASESSSDRCAQERLQDKTSATAPTEYRTAPFAHAWADLGLVAVLAAVHDPGLDESVEPRSGSIVGHRPDRGESR